MLGCAALFLVLTSAAMWVFEGGSPYDALSRHYLFLDNTFSDLGGLQTYSGRDNDRSRALFTVALLLIGTSIVGFGPTWRAWDTQRRATRMGPATSAFAGLSGLGFLAIALLPWDKDVVTHDNVVRATFGLLAGFIVCLSIVQIRNRAPRLWIGANVLYLLGLIGYGLMQAIGPELSTRPGLRAQVGTQKVIVYASVLNLALQAWGVRTRATVARPALRQEDALGRPVS